MQEPPRDSIASNPGGVAIERIRFIRTQGGKIFGQNQLWLGVAMVGVVLFLKGFPPELGLGFVTVGLAVLTYRVKKEWDYRQMKFLYGCVNPALVVGDSPWRIAVLTNLGKGDGVDYPVVKIVDINPQKWTPQDLHIGTRLGTVAMYCEAAPGSEADAEGRWADFEPEVTDDYTSNAQAIRKVLDSIGPQEWHNLEMALHKIPSPPVPGLYLLD